MQCIMELMPRANRELESFCGNMLWQSLFHSEQTEFKDFDKFLKGLIEAYRMVLHSGKVMPTHVAAVVAVTAPPTPPSDIAALLAALVDSRSTMPPAGSEKALASAARSEQAAGAVVAMAVEPSIARPRTR